MLEIGRFMAVFCMFCVEMYSYWLFLRIYNT